MQALEAQNNQLVLVPALYHAEVQTIYDTIKAQPNHCSTVAIFSHNPGITFMANSLGVASIDDMPTCAMFGVYALCNAWSEFDTAEKRYWLFDYPKL